MDNNIVITWKHRDSGEYCFVGKWCVGCAYYDGMRQSRQKPYTVTCSLTGAKPKFVGLDSMDYAKNLLERVVRHWFACAMQADEQ